MNDDHLENWMAATVSSFRRLAFWLCLLFLLPPHAGSQTREEGDVDRLSQQLRTRPFDAEAATKAFVALTADRPEIVVELLHKHGEGMEERMWWNEAMRWMLGSAGSAAIPGLKLAMTDPRSTVRFEAAAALLECNRETRLALLPQLTDALGEKDERVLSMVSTTVASLGEGALPAYHTLTNRLVKAGRQSQGYFIIPLVNLGRAAEPAMPLIEKALSRWNGSWTERIVTGLDRGQGDPELVMPLLIQALKSREWLIRRAAAMAVENHREHAADAIPVLKDLLATDPDPHVRHALATALAAADSNQTDFAVQVLVETLQDQREESRSARAHAAGELGKMGSAAKTALPVLLCILEENREAAMATVASGPVSDAHWLAMSVIHTLGALGPDAQAAFPAVIEMTASGEFLTANAARWACIRIAPEKKELLAGVLEQLNSPDEYERVEAIWILRKLKPKAPAVQKALLGMLDDGSILVRLHAATTLAADGLGGEKTRSVLISGLTHSEHRLRSEVRQALRRLPMDAEKAAR